MDIVFRTFDPTDESAIIELWKRCGLTRPWNDPKTDIALKLQHSPKHFLVGVIDDRIVASAMAGYDGHRGTVYYLAIDPDLQGQGYGRQLMNEVERVLEADGCPKVNILFRNENERVLDFYKAIDYTDNDCVSMGKRLDGKSKT